LVRLPSAALSWGWNLVRRWALFADFLLFGKALKGGGQYAACFSRLTLMVRPSGRLKSVGGSLCPNLPTAEGDAWMNVVKAHQGGTAQPTLRRIGNEKRPSMIVGNDTIALVTWMFNSRTRTSAEDHPLPGWRVGPPETGFEEIAPR
jgi:hypothetical protein